MDHSLLSGVAAWLGQAGDRLPTNARRSVGFHCLKSRRRSSRFVAIVQIGDNGGETGRVLTARLLRTNTLYRQSGYCHVGAKKDAKGVWRGTAMKGGP